LGKTWQKRSLDDGPINDPGPGSLIKKRPGAKRSERGALGKGRGPTGMGGVWYREIGQKQIPLRMLESGRGGRFMKQRSDGGGKTPKVAESKDKVKKVERGGNT